MKKNILFLLIVSLLISCESKIEKMIPASQLIGGVPNINITMEGDLDKCKEDSDDSTAITAYGIVPFDIKREQIRPSILAVLKVTKSKYPRCEKIFVDLAPDEEIGKWGYFVGRAEYEKGNVKLNYGIPSEEQMKEHNSKIGKAEHPFKEGEGLFDLDYSKTIINDWMPLRVPDQSTFSTSKQVFLKCKAVIFNSKSKITQPPYKNIGRDMGLSAADTERYFRFATTYYGFMGSGRGEEVINLRQ